MHGSFALVVLIACSLWIGAHGTSFTLPCSQYEQFPTFWLNSTLQSTEITGSQFTVYPNKPDGTAYTSTWQRLRWIEAFELSLVKSTIPGRYKCPTELRRPDDALPYLLRSLDFENSCICKGTTGTRPFKPGISERFVDFEVTRPDWPDFKLSMNFSLVNESWSTIVPASAETFFLEYPLNWTSQVPKVSFQITNWNWTATGVANTTLRLFFHASTQADEDTILQYSEDNIPQRTFTTNTTNAYFQTIILGAFAADGIDYVISDAPAQSVDIVLSKDSPQLLPMGVSLCHAAFPPPMTYSDLFYDPSIAAIFTGDFAQPTDPNTPQNNKNKPLNPAAYAVPIVIAAIIIGAVAITVFVPSVRRKIRGDSDPFATVRNTNRAAAATASSPAPAPAAAPAEPEPTAKSDKKAWARSARPETP